MFDWPHLIKCLRNNWMEGWEDWVRKNPAALKQDCPGQTMIWDGKTVKWRDIIVLQQKEAAAGAAHDKLTETHVFPLSKERMKVKNAAQVFSQRTANALKILSAYDKSIETANFANTAEVVEDMNNVFDAVNGPHPRSKNSKITNPTSDSHHIETWAKFRAAAVNLKFINLQGRIFQPPCQKNLVMSLSALQDFWQELLKIQFKKLILRRLNQDPLENLFGLIRQNCGADANPSCAHFESALKTILITRHAVSGVDGGNCEKDDMKLLLDLKNFSSSTDSSAEIGTNNNSSSSHSNNYYDSPPD